MSASEAEDREAGGRDGEKIFRELSLDPERRAESLGEAFLACRARGTRAASRVPLRRPAGRAWGCSSRGATQPTRGTTRGPRGGWLGLFVGGDARAIDAGEPGGTSKRRGAERLDLSRKALTKAISIADTQGNRTLKRNLGWYREPLSRPWLREIASRTKRPVATIRTRGWRAPQGDFCSASSMSSSTRSRHRSRGKRQRRSSRLPAPLDRAGP